MTRLKCKQYKCSNYKSEVNQYIDRRDYADKQAERPPRKAELNDLLCKVHAGGLKRSRWQTNPVPLTNKDRTRLLKEQAKLDEEARAENEQANIETDKRDARLHAEEWAELNAVTHWFISPDEPGLSTPDEPTFAGKVWSGESPDRWDSGWFDIRPEQRNYGGEGRKYPYIIRMTRGANLTPMMARALAEALVAGAEKAEELNALRAPKEEEVPA